MLKPIKASQLVSIMAISEVIFRLPWGYVSDLKGMNRHYLLGFLLISLGLSLVAIAWSTSYVMLACICGFSGVFQVLYSIKCYHKVLGPHFLTLIFFNTKIF